MRIAVVGSGISGLASAWLLSREHEVVLFERELRLGGHTHTHRVSQAGREYRVDSGFIVFNPDNYPLLGKLFGELGIRSQPTTMSFAVQDARNGLEYNATSLKTMFCQRRNLLSPRFWRMLREILRFYREAPALLQRSDEGPSLGDYLAEGGYSAMFSEDHLIPMTAALWSSPSDQVLRFPARYLVQFMANHQMLSASARPEWRVVVGGSASYIDAMQTTWQVETRLDSPVQSVRRNDAGVEVHSRHGVERFDQLVLACHSDQSLALLADADAREHEILSAMPYQANDTVLHTDARMLPRRRAAWAAWNAYIPATPGRDCTVSYCMNLLQSLDSPKPFVVSLGRGNEIDPEEVIARMRYHHPIHTRASVAAQSRRAEIQGRRRTWFAGAYWGWGFHEDGIRSAVDVVRALGVRWP